MKKVLIVISEMKLLYALLRNTKFIPEKNDVENIPLIILKNILSKNGITVVIKDFDNNINGVDIIITDDLHICESIKTIPIFLLSPIVDCNTSYGYLSELNFTPSNLNFISPTINNLYNTYFDLSLILNYMINDDKWGKYHYAAYELFNSIKLKECRVDYSVREIKKINRIKFLYRLIDTHLNENIKISVHNSVLSTEESYKLVEEYFTKFELHDEFDKIKNINKKYLSIDDIDKNFNSWVLNKLYNHTLKSDISIYFECGTESDIIKDCMNDLITEKTIDLLSIGKPFIYMNKSVGTFLEEFGFRDYNKEVFDGISKDKVELVRKISFMPMSEYDSLLKKLSILTTKNRKRLDEIIKNNTFLYNLIHN
jgi:hypothetical protein